MQALDGRFVAQQIQGDRDYQEDDFGLLDSGEASLDATDPHAQPKKTEHSLMVLTDGMGGHKGGGVASGIVTRTFLEIYEHANGDVPARLERSLFAANDALSQAINNNKNLSGMGTTLVAIVATDHGIEWLSVGDSPLWLYRDGSLERLNEDHSMAPVLDDLVATGRLSEEDKDKDGRKNSLRSALMGDEIAIIDTSPTLMALLADDIIVLASDGLETLPEKIIAKTIKKNRKKGLEVCVSALMQRVEKANKQYQDNCTVLVYRPPLPEGDEEVDNKAGGLMAGFKGKILNLFGQIGRR